MRRKHFFASIIPVNDRIDLVVLSWRSVSGIVQLSQSICADTRWCCGLSTLNQIISDHTPPHKSINSLISASFQLNGPKKIENEMFVLRLVHGEMTEDS